jgi:hypothetical protein
VALPSSSYTTFQVTDDDALDAIMPYTKSVFTVNDSGETTTNYDVYTMTNAAPYTSSHKHQITWS